MVSKNIKIVNDSPTENVQQNCPTKLDFVQTYTVLPRLSDTLGTMTCSDNQKVWIIKQADKNSYKKSSETVDLLISYSWVISLLEDPLLMHSQIVILSSIDKTVHLHLVAILAICKISVDHWKYFDCGIWLETVRTTKYSDNQRLDNRGTTVVSCWNGSEDSLWQTITVYGVIFAQLYFHELFKV